jgi:aminoglycoside 6'-N-acetyltransferase
MTADPRISFEPVSERHYDLLRSWLDRPHWREWWGDPDTEFGYIRDMVEGRDTHGRPFIFSVDGTAAGYIQYWFLGPHQTEEWSRDNPWLMEFPSHTVGVDLSIGDGASLSKGYGSLALRAFVRLLREQGHDTIIIDPDPRNLRAVRAYENAGFVAVPRLLGRYNDVLIMQHALKDSGPPP